MAHSTSNKKNLPQIVLFGDSLTQWSFEEYNRGFGWALEQNYAGKAEILNEAMAGFTSSMLKVDFEYLIKRQANPNAPPTLLFTIFLGANDACILPQGEYVPLPKFEENIRFFVESILIEDHMAHTKIVLITPPPINIPDPVEEGGLSVSAAAAAAIIREGKNPKESRSYRTYLSKKRYAEKIMEIANEYGETGRVVGLDLWKALVDAALGDQGRLGDEDAYDEERLPGCGLKWAKMFERGYFTDGLHFGPKAYDVLSKGLLDLTLTRWPELAPENLGK